MAYDSLRQGTITETQFRSVLCMAGLALTNQEIQSVLARYRDPRADWWERINYGAFCEDVRKTPAVGAGLRASPSSPAPPPPWPSQRAAEVAEGMRRSLRERKVDAPNEFTRYDRAATAPTGRLTRDAFRRAIVAMFPPSLLPHVDDRMLDVLCERYRDPVSGFCHYLPFLRDFYEAQPLIDLGYLDQHTFLAPGGPPPLDRRPPEKPADAWAVVQRLHRDVKLVPISLKDCFRSDDRLHTGRVPRDKFGPSLLHARLKPPLTGAEVEALGAAFADPERPETVDYLRFCDAVYAGSLAPRAARPETESAKGRAAAAEEQGGAILRAIAKETRDRRVELKPQFKEHDTGRPGGMATGRIARPRFEMILGSLFPARALGLLADRRAMEILYRKYDPDGAGVRYPDFCRDVQYVDPQEPIGPIMFEEFRWTDS
eukprot:tig00000989_g6087.t1